MGQVIFKHSLSQEDLLIDISTYPVHFQKRLVREITDVLASKTKKDILLSIIADRAVEIVKEHGN